ncbi:MAG: HlyD family efflux transporter periplasmic adaptor subunit [Planctomycetota bacterium]
MITGVLLLVWHELRPRPTVISGYIEADEIRVGSRVGGRVKQVLAIEGQELKAGDVLLRLEPFDLEEQLAQANAELDAAIAVHAKLVAGSRPEEIAEAMAERDRAQAAVDEALAGARPQEIKQEADMLALSVAESERVEQTYQRIAGLARTGDATPEDLDRVTSERKAALARVEASRARLDLLRAGTRPEQIAQARAQLAAATAHLDLRQSGERAEDIAQAKARVDSWQARVRSITTQIAELEIHAPCACMVEAIDLQPGDLIGAGAPVISLMNLDSLWIRAFLPESWLGWVHVNDQVEFAVDSFPRQRFPARVTFVSRNAEFTPSNIQTPEERSKQVYRIKVAIERDRNRFRPGMAADVSITKPSAP